MQTLKLGLLMAAILLAAKLAQASDLDRAIVKAAWTYKVPVRILRAIATVESSFGKQAVLRKNRNGTYDTGALQINSIHWQYSCKHLDVATLQGNVNCGALLLAQHQRHAKTDSNWFARFHSKTPSLKSQYSTKVKKVLQLQSNDYKLYLSK